MEQSNELEVVLIGGVNYGGKSTLGQWLVDECPQFFTNSISATSRLKRLANKNRPEEIEGVDYYFVDASVFTKEDFIEFEKFVNEKGDETFYGTPKSELERAYREGKILVLVLEPKGIDNFYKNINTVEVDGKTISLKKTVVLLDITEKNVYARLDELVDKQKEPELYAEEVGRIERGNLRELIDDLGIRGYADVVREKYLPEKYIGDIIGLMPERVKSFIKTESDEKKEKEAMLKSAFLEVVNDKAYSKTSLREMYEMIKQWSLYRSLVDLVAKKHNVPAEDIIEYGKSHLEYPMYWNDPSGINSDKCRFLNGSILRELIEEAIEDSANITSDEVSQIEVGVHTPHGFEDSVKLADINDFCLRRLGITEEQLEKLGENDLVKSVRTKNEFKRGNNEYAERKMPDKKLI